MRGRLVQQQARRAAGPGRGRRVRAAAHRLTDVVTSRSARSDMPACSSASIYEPLVLRQSQLANGRVGRCGARPMRTTSRTVKGSETAVSCGTTPYLSAPSRAHRGHGTDRVHPAAPHRTAGWSARDRARTRVDFPDPLGPITPTNSPGRSGQAEACQDRRRVGFISHFDLIRHQLRRRGNVAHNAL